MAYISFQPSDYFNTKLYTGTGSAQSLTGVGFQPDLVWCKDRTNSYDQVWFDAVRGATKRIRSNVDGAETTASTDLTSFDSDGFTIGSGSNINNSGNNFVSWNWKANGAGSANTDGSTSSTVSANTTAGFSIVKWSGTGSTTTVGHGLGATPACFITKSTGTGGWGFYHQSVGNTKALILNESGAGTTHSAYYNNTSPTSTVFTVNSDSSVNHSGNDMIAYCFAEKKGFSKFGSYVGNNSTWGTFVNCGFKPGMVIVKCDSNASTNWVLLDNKRSSVGGPNPNDRWLYANAVDAEVDQSGNPTDFLSNGFKLKNNGGYMNGSGRTYIYMAFAEQPLVSSNNIPATAR